MPIGSTIHAWRLFRGQSVPMLAEKAGLLASTLEAIEAEELDPHASTLDALALALEVPASWLYGDPRVLALLLDDGAGELVEPLPVQSTDPVTEQILLASRSERELFALLTTLLRRGDPKLIRAAEMSLQSLVKQSKQASVPWEKRPPGHFEPPSD